MVNYQEGFHPYGGYGKRPSSGGSDGGGGGGGGAQTVDVWLWNDTQNAELAEVIPASVKYVSGYENGETVHSEISFEHVTETNEGTTVHGIRMSNVPVGAFFDRFGSFSWTETGVYASDFGFGYSFAAFPPGDFESGPYCPMPVDGLFVTGYYQLATAS